MGLWKRSFRKAFFALVIVLALLSVFLVVLKGSGSMRENSPTAQNAGISIIKIRENNTQHEFSLPEVKVSLVHGSEGFTLRDLNIWVSDKNSKGA